MDFTKDSIEPVIEDYNEVDGDSLPAGQCSSPSVTSNSGPEDCSRAIQRELSAWEKWIVKKALDDKARAEQERLLQKKEAEAAKALRRAQREKKCKSVRAYREWLADKAKKETPRIQEKGSGTGNRLEDTQKNDTIEDKCKARYDEWRAKKRAEKLLKEKLQLEEEKKQALLAKERRERGAKAYRDWMRVNYDRQLETNWHSRLDEKRTYLHSRK